MVEVEGMDRKIFRTSHLPKSMRNPIVPSTPPPPKKSKAQVAVAVSPALSPGSVSGSPPATSPSAIKQLLSGPVKKTTAPTSPLPEPILSTLGASLSPPTKPSPDVAVKKAQNVITGASQPTAAGAIASTNAAGDAVKFLVDCPDVVVVPKPVKRNRKKQAMPTPSLPATGKPLGGTILKPLGGISKTPKVSPAKASIGGSPVNPSGSLVKALGSPVKILGSPVKGLGSPVKGLGSPVKGLGSPVKLVAAAGNLTGGAQKVVMPKLKNLLSPTKKVPTGVAVTMADQPVLSKMMGEVGQVQPIPQIPIGMSIGPPPPSSAEAKSMKKKAKKEAAAALKVCYIHGFLFFSRRHTKSVVMRKKVISLTPSSHWLIYFVTYSTLMCTTILIF